MMKSLPNSPTNEHSMYQLDYSEQQVGKSKPDSKVIVTWRYAVGSQEHAVELTWSFRSGKQSITMDGVQEYFNCVKGASILDKKFETRDGTEIRVVGTRTKPNNASYSFRCFELLVNGQSFVSFRSQGANQSRDEEQFRGDGAEPQSILDILHPDRNNAQGLMPPQLMHQSQPNCTGVPAMEPATDYNMHDQASTAAPMHEAAPVQPVQQETQDLISFE